MTGTCLMSITTGKRRCDFGVAMAVEARTIPAQMNKCRSCGLVIDRDGHWLREHGSHRHQRIWINV
jgi:hypothetical protein